MNAEDQEPMAADQDCERLAERFGWARRHRTLMTVAIVSALLVACGGVLRFIQLQRNRLEQERQAQQTVGERAQQKSDEQQRVASAALKDEVLGLAELHASRFGNAARIFASGADRVRAVPELAETYQRLAARHDRARRLDMFYALWNLTERLASTSPELLAERSDLETIAACRAGLQEINVFSADDPAVKGDTAIVQMEWWERLPADDLTPGQRRRLENDAGAALCTLALWRTRQLFFKLKSDEFRDVHQWLTSLQDYNRARQSPLSLSAESLDAYCRYRLNEMTGERLAPTEPNGAADAFFLGMTHAYLDEPSIAVAATTVMETFPRELKDQLALDFDNPRRTAEKYLRLAVALEPEHYWAHYHLGKLLERSADLAGAEQCYDTCVGLRPQYTAAHSGRARILLQQVADLDELLKNSKMSPADEAQSRAQLADLKLRAYHSLDQGLATQPNDSALHWLRFNTLVSLQRVDEALAEVQLVGSLEAARFAAEGRRDEFGKGLSGSALQHIVDWDYPQLTAELQSARATLHLAQGEIKSAQQLSDEVLAKNPKHVQCLAVRGMLRLQNKDWQGAHDDFQLVRSVQPQHPLASLGLAWTHEGTKNWRASLGVFDQLLSAAEESPAGSDWRELAIHLGRARALHGLGKTAERDSALERARRLNPLMAEEARAKLLDQASK